jgi:hypothetical protein
VEPEASSVEKSVVLRPAGRPLMKGEMSTPSTLRPSSARILQAAGSVATSSLPSPGTCPLQDLWRLSSSSNPADEDLQDQSHAYYDQML